jgi:seryl-tRNA synthetase
MIDINLIREKPEWVKAQIARLHDSAPIIDEILAADTRRREIIGEVEALRRQRNESSKQIGARMGTLKKLEGRPEPGRRGSRRRVADADQQPSVQRGRGQG